jgi:hypothetical protein
MRPIAANPGDGYDHRDRDALSIGSVDYIRGSVRDRGGGGREGASRVRVASLLLRAAGISPCKAIEPGG